ncbi:MAG TPA: tetratricopeptide repeat protein [Candidatus Baltobacteraceae bacterium]|nr:tetratricopeptide repeat protein [Candidatus Baltobacteraceae bacterium]
MRLLVIALAFLLPGAAPSAAMPLDAIVSHHIAALGGIKATQSITSVIERGWYREGTFQIDTYAAQMRPFYRVIGDIQKDPLGEIHEGYDGSAWEYYPDPGIVVRTVGAAADAARHTAPIDDPLVQYISHRVALTIGDPATVLGNLEYTIHAKLSDDFAEDIYVNPGTWMIDAEKRIVPMHAFGKRYTTIDVFTDYRPEGGVMRAHGFKEVDQDTGNSLTESEVTSVEVNPSLPLSMFSPPTWKRTPLQEMIAHIYEERDEGRSVMATYRDFTPLLDVRADATGDAVDFVGYQCLKMGHADTAVMLLEQNVADHPSLAGAHFGLGRAYQASGNAKAARDEYRRALSLDPKYERAKEALDAMAAGTRK